ncbi:hypothetical protein AB0M25_14820 [Streptomyces griseomycini]
MFQAHRRQRLGQLRNIDYAQLLLGALLLVAVMANNYFRKLALSGR